MGEEFGHKTTETCTCLKKLKLTAVLLLESVFVWGLKSKRSSGSEYPRSGKRFRISRFDNRRKPFWPRGGVLEMGGLEGGFAARGIADSCWGGDWLYP